MHEAGRRIHGTMRKVALELFEIERPLMRELLAIAPDLSTWHKVSVHRYCDVAIFGALRLDPQDVVATHDQRVRRHLRRLQIGRLACTRSRPGDRFTVRHHLPPEACAFLAHDRQWCLEQAARVRPACGDLIDLLLANHVRERLRAAQGVMRLQQPYGASRLEAACARALARASPFYRTVKTILVGGFDRHPSAIRGTRPRPQRMSRPRRAVSICPDARVRH